LVQRKNSKYIYLSLMLGVAAVSVPFSIPATAQVVSTSNAPHGSMASLVRQVVETNPEIKAQKEQVRITKARLQAAEAGYLPTIEANGLVQKREIDVKNGGAGDARFIAGQASVEARVRFYDGDRTYNSIQISKAEIASAQAGLDALVSDVLLDLLTSAADVHANRRIRDFSQMQSDAIGEQLRATTRRLEFGESTRTDENLAKARMATAQAGILAASQELNVNGYRFRAISGQSATVVPPLPELAAVPASLTDAQALATAASPRLLAARQNALAGRKGVNLAAGALLPQVDAVGGYEYLTGGVANLFTGRLPDDRSALYGGLEVRVPIFQPRDWAELRRARAVRDQREAQTEFADRTVTEEVASSWARWQSAKATIVSAQEAVSAIEKAADGIRKESIGGNRTLTDVLDAQNELLAARITLERATRNEFVARVGLLAATGQLDADAVYAGSATPANAATGRPAVSPLGAAQVQLVAPATAAIVAAPTATAALADPAIQSGTEAIDGSNRPKASALGRPKN
jgi:outer membrane protein